ncbi:MAG: bifunctional metallophosphatase/5'-nucleotidase [Gammaproteobacteria bacterium]|nr:bifunctional metallophosphatase/5'-nucleotidase [Gammaproteobacteria bacterium]
MIKIIGFNDFHGTLLSPGNFPVQPGGSGTATISKPAGGVDFMAGWVNKLKSQNPNHVVVSAGDLIGASPLISAFFHDEGTIETMNRLGLEFNAVGNHEFDEGKAELMRMQNGGCHSTDVNSCKGLAVGTPVPFEGAKFKFLSANVVDTASGRTLFPSYAIKRFNGKRVAFIGMTLKDTPSIVTPAGVAGLTFNDEAGAVNALIPQLKKRGVKAIVVLIHQGGFQGSAQPNFINDCSAALQDPTTSPIKGIVSRLDDAVDLVISGHTHTGFICHLPNKADRVIPVTQASAFGRVLTDIDMTLDNRTGDVTGIVANNVTVDRTDPAVTADASIASIVAGYNTLVSPLANQIIGTIIAALPNTANAAGEMEAGDLIADAQLAATQPAQFGAAEIALMNAGGVRNPGFNTANATYPHAVTYQEAFTVQPFGNSLVTMTLTAQQLKEVLEQQFPGSNCVLPSGAINVQTVQRVMQPSSGLNYAWSTTGSPCAKVVNVTVNGTPIVSNGTVLNPTATFRVTVNNFMATGGDNFTVLTQGLNRLGGAQDIDALLAYMANFKAPNAPYDPTAASLNKPRIIKLP